MIDTAPAAYVHPAAVMMGDVRLGLNCALFAGAVLRADVNYIKVGGYTNIQENCMVHVDETPAEIGDFVTVAHGAVVHACTIGNNVLVGIHAVILDGAKIGDGCVIGANTLVREGTVMPPGSLAVGSPARIIEGKGSAALGRHNAIYYYQMARRFAQGRFSFPMQEILDAIAAFENEGQA